jgi:hypothetical protein
MQRSDRRTITVGAIERRAGSKILRTIHISVISGNEGLENAACRDYEKRRQTSAGKQRS